MGKPLNWMLSGAPAKSLKSRTLRTRLAATTILAVAPFLGYGRHAYAECLPAPPPLTHLCTGTSAGENFTGGDAVNNANFATESPFEVTTDGVAIAGFGHIRFTDENASTIVNKDGTGLSLTSYGDYEDTPGAVTIVTDGTITGYNGDGIHALNEGSGDITITADGVVTGLSDDPPDIPADGIYAKNFGRDITITTGAQSDIFGTENGIDARNGDYYSNNEDARNITINANGYVTGDVNDAIHARNYGVDLTITTGTQSVVRGGGHGIGANNYGSGNLAIEANGWVGGYAYDSEFGESTGDGINAFNSEDGRTLTITTGAASTIRGANDGIDALNRGSGALSITADAEVTGYDGSGIFAKNFGTSEDTGEALTITTGPDSDVFGQKDGIDAINHGNGLLSINVNGNVTGQGEFHGYDERHREGDGIFAKNFGTGLVIETGSGSVVTGVGDDGIDARQHGFGDLRITVNGSTTGQGEDGAGIDAYHGSFLTRVAGPQTLVDGPQALVVDPATYITVGAGGVSQGNYAGIRAVSGNEQKIFIANDGLVRNLSTESHHRAIVTRGGVTNIDNNSDLIGTVTLDGYYEFDDILNNDGFWNMAGGTSDFGLGWDTVNNTRTLLGADDPANIEHSTIRRLEVFNNLGGLISLVDGQQGDTMTLLAECNDQACKDVTLLEYTGTNGQLLVDTVLGQAPPNNQLLSDELRISGNTNGTTTVHVNVVAATGANTEGIPVIRILDDGTSAEEHFNLDGPVNGGFFIWDMRYDEANNWHELYTVTTNPDGTGDPVLGVGALEIPAGFGAGQDIWFQTVGTLLQRQADLRSVLQGVNVTPVADFSEPVEPTPVATISPGFWFKGFATYIDRDDEENGIELDRKQTIYGGMAGFDFGTREVVGDALLFGIFGGYIASDLDFNSTNTEWTYEGPTVGAYVTYLDQAFYADATVKVDFLDVDIDPTDLGGDDTDTDALNIGGRIDTGYKFGHTAYVEPQATLAVVHSEMDDLDIFGGTVEFDDDTSVRGRLGLRVGVDHTHDDATVYMADVTASVWENFTGGDSEVTIVDTGLPDFGASDDSLSTYGDISLGIGVANPDGWSTFVRGNYLFADDYEAFAGNAGVRFVW